MSGDLSNHPVLRGLRSEAIGVLGVVEQITPTKGGYKIGVRGHVFFTAIRDKHEKDLFVLFSDQTRTTPVPQSQWKRGERTIAMEKLMEQANSPPS